MVTPFKKCHPTVNFFEELIIYDKLLRKIHYICTSSQWYKICWKKRHYSVICVICCVNRDLWDLSTTELCIARMQLPYAYISVNIVPCKVKTPALKKQKQKQQQKNYPQEIR